MDNLRQVLNIFDGTKTLSWDVSVAQVDLIATFNIPIISSVQSKIAHTFEFYCRGDMLVSINGSSPILIGSGDELELKNIWSFKTITPSIEYRYFAQY